MIVCANKYISCEQNVIDDYENFLSIMLSIWYTETLMTLLFVDVAITVYQLYLSTCGRVQNYYHEGHIIINTILLSTWALQYLGNHWAYQRLESSFEFNLFTFLVLRVQYSRTSSKLWLLITEIRLWVAIWIQPSYFSNADVSIL